MAALVTALKVVSEHPTLDLPSAQVTSHARGAWHNSANDVSRERVTSPRSGVHSDHIQLRVKRLYATTILGLPGPDGST